MLPPSLFTVIEGIPGTWKYFVLKTIRNITRQLTNSNNADMESSPTGVAAALIYGTAHCRCNYIPVGKLFQKCPFNFKGSDTTKHRSFRMKTALVKTCVMDEHSLAGRAYWSWLQHRSEELRQSSSILDENGQLLYSETSILHEEVHQRT